MTKTLELPQSAKDMIFKYWHLNLGKDGVRCPYYMNLKRSKDLRAMVGKGTPDEIEMEARIWEKLKGINFKKMNEKEIREFLVNRGLGIDCSGFVIHVLNYWHKDATGKSIWKGLQVPNKDFLHRIAYFLKPVEKLGAEVITDETNSKRVGINEVLPGDVVRTKWKKQNSHHILLISAVRRNEAGDVDLIEYTHSIPFYGEESGIKVGQIKVTDPKKPLETQEWLEKDEHGVNHVLEGYMIQLNDNGIRRIKAMEKLQKEEFQG